MILAILRILGQFRELFVGPGHLAATTSNWESAAAECHQCHGCNIFGGLEIEIELHTRKLNMSLKKGTISTGNTSSNHWFSRDILVFRGEKPMVGRLNGKPKRVQFWILCEVVLLCFAWSEHLGSNSRTFACRHLSTWLMQFMCHVHRCLLTYYFDPDLLQADGFVLSLRVVSSRCFPCSFVVSFDDFDDYILLMSWC